MENKKPQFKSIALAFISLILVAGSCGVAAAGSCSSSMSALSTCMPAVEGDNPASPTDACCAVIRSTDTSCLCNIVTTYSNAMGVNVHAALLLPKECKHPVPAGYTCDGYLVPSYIPPQRKLMSV